MGRFPGRASAALVALLAIWTGLAIAGCSDQGRGVSVNILNGSSHEVIVRFEEPGHEMVVGQFRPTQGIEFKRVFQELGPACHGPFVARTLDGQEVDRAEELCPGVTWTINDPGTSPPPG